MNGKQINIFLTLPLPGTQEWEQQCKKCFETHIQTSKDFFFNALLIYKCALEGRATLNPDGKSFATTSDSLVADTL